MNRCIVIADDDPNVVSLLKLRLGMEQYDVVATNDAVSLAATNDLLPFVDHLSEADLVRQKVKDGEDDEDAEPAERPTPPKPVIRDPVLARAVDLLKGLAVVRMQHG